LQHALKELWEIDTLARTETPDLAPNLRYSVLTSRRGIKNFESALARWRPEELTDTESVEAFRARVSVRVETEPRLTLASFLLNAFGDPDPFGNIEKWLGRLISVPTPAGFEESCASIVVDLATLEIAARERIHRFHVWDSQDRGPHEPRFESDPTKATLAGQVPSRNHLIEGRFAHRWFYGALLEKAEEWLADIGLGNNDSRLPAFWISGRSGTGKSVALLHLLADLHREDEERVIVWLDNQADRLAEAIRWARPFFAEGKQVILAADDPYTSERYQKVTAAVGDAMREFDSIAIAYPTAMRPTMVFAGPPNRGSYSRSTFAIWSWLISFRFQRSHNAILTNCAIGTCVALGKLTFQ
jgi:hypothetical protein